VSKTTQSERLYNYTRQRAESKTFQILRNVSSVHTLFPNNARVNKTKKISAAGRPVETENDGRSKWGFQTKWEKSRTENAYTPRKYRKKLEGKWIFRKCNALYSLIFRHSSKMKKREGIHVLRQYTHIKKNITFLRKWNRFLLNQH